jgi:hypothetical protein
MTISTCSYAGWLPEHGQPVRITLGPPRRPEPTGRDVWLYVAELAPQGWYFRAGPEKFDRCYAAQLARHAAAIEMKLTMLTDQFGDLCLCCFERAVRGPAECHRLQFGAWWTARTGQPVPEHDPA